jgi:NADH-quinone oxidoreductase subunit L
MNSIALILGLPLIGFIINGLVGKQLPKIVSGILGISTILVAFILTASQLSQFVSNESYSQSLKLFTFLNVDNLVLEASFKLDRLSIWMTMIITGIGTLIHVYSMAYMWEDEGFHKFFSYLNFFVFNMLLLVLGSNFLMLFFGWEGVGLCSYLLIGFWYSRPEYGKAARKAFVMNRIGDLGLLLGMFLLIHQFGTLDYDAVIAGISQGKTSAGMLTAISVLLFVGAMGKSAQIPLYTWLPDAMAGPTPVSALIHAATMVTAGIYLIVRTQVLFEMAPFTSEFIFWIGLCTSILAALIGLKQNDIKKVLAYSTVSQLGFMFVALGCGAYTTAMFHLTTHAFFKALLFLGAGSVIHGVHHEQDIRLMGGLKSKMPITYITFLIGTLAITGFPFLSGFFSKDEILTHVFEHNKLGYGLMVFSALLTGIYMFRMFFVTFHGSYRNTHFAFDKVHESPTGMTLPLVVLAILSLAGGALNLPEYLMHQSGILANWLKPILTIEETKHAISHSTEYILIGIAVLVFIVAFLFTRSKYVSKNHVPSEEESTGVQGYMENKFYVDELYNTVFVKPLEGLSDILGNFFETKVISPLSFGINSVLTKLGRLNRYIQDGNIEKYLLFMVIGIVILIGINLFI